MAERALKATTLGKQAKTDLPAAVFGEDFHESLLQEAARADMAARRRGTASTLGRGEVAMTTAKAWRQKGTGRARAGALSVPHRRGGGVAFGPKPRGYAVKVNRKARRRALRAALSLHAERGTLAVVDASAFGEPSTQQAAKALEKFGEGRALVVLAREGEEPCVKSFRNLPGVTVLPADGVGVADIVGAARLVLSQAAVDELGRVAAAPSPRAAKEDAQ